MFMTLVGWHQWFSRRDLPCQDTDMYKQHKHPANSVCSCNSTRGRGFTVRVSDIPSHSIHHVYSHFTRRRPLLSWRTRDTFMAQASVAQAAHNVNVFMNAELMWKAPHEITTRVTRLTVTRNGVIQDFRLADLRKLNDPRYRWCWAWELSGGLRPSSLSPGLNHSTPRASALLRRFTIQDLRIVSPEILYHTAYKFNHQNVFTL